MLLPVQDQNGISEVIVLRWVSTMLLIALSPRTDTLVNTLIAYIITTGRTHPACSVLIHPDKGFPKAYSHRADLSRNSENPHVDLSVAIFVSVDAILGTAFVRRSPYYYTWETADHVIVCCDAYKLHFHGVLLQSRKA